MKIDLLEANIGYAFSDKNILNLALIHSSAVNDNHSASNQRLEFLGDAVLQLIISTYLYSYREDENEGILSKLRSLIVCADSLYVAAENIKLQDFLMLGKGEELSGGRKKKNILADAFESIIGAIYLDGGYDAAKTFVMDKLSDIISESLTGQLRYDYKTSLQEYVQRDELGQLSYKLIDVKGPEHDQTFISCAVINEKSYKSAKGHNRKQSEQQAAKLALIALGYIDEENQ